MSNDDVENDEVIANVSAEKGNLVVDFEPMGILYGENAAEALYQKLDSDIIPKSRWKTHDFVAVASFFIITHGLIEDRAAEILSIEFGGNRQDAGHANNIDELEKHGIIDGSMAKKMRMAKSDREATHHGFREMIDQLLESDFSTKVERMRDIRIKMREEIIKRKNGPILDD